VHQEFVGEVAHFYIFFTLSSFFRFCVPKIEFTWSFTRIIQKR